MNGARIRRVLFRCSNRRGLGHLVRGLNIARAVHRRAPDVEIGLFTRGSVPAEIAEPGLVSMVRASVNGNGWDAALESFDPSVTVDDTLLPERPPPSDEGRRSVFVMRRCRAPRQRELLGHAVLRAYDRILVPHEEREFGFDVPADLADRTRFVGPIVREPHPAMHAPLRLRYGLTREDFVVISTPGGGGFAGHAASFIRAVTLAHRELVEALPRLRHILVTGPCFRGSVDPTPGMRVVAAEPNLVSLLGLADCVVCAGGYNTVNEVRCNRVPAVLLPGARSHDDQAERVAWLAEAGLAVVADGPAERQARTIVEVCTSPAALSRMRERYAEDFVLPGNGPAADEIVKLLPW